MRRSRSVFASATLFSHTGPRLLFSCTCISSLIGAPRRSSRSLERAQESIWPAAAAAAMADHHRKRSRAIADAEEDREEARLEEMRRQAMGPYAAAAAAASPGSIVPRRIRPKHTHEQADGNSNFGAAGRASSTVSVTSSGAASVASSRMSAPRRPPLRHFPLLARSGSTPNVLASMHAVRLGTMSPGKLRDQVIARRVNSIKLAQSKEIVTTHVQTINDLDVDRTEAR
jgi:hypothetical protein